MKVQNIFSGSERLVVFILLIFMSATCFSQDDDESPPSNVRRSKLSVGLYVGTLFSDNNTAWLYDGYGYDVNGQKNDFSNSYNAIVLNFTASKLAVGGEFTITLLTTSQVPQQPGYINYKTFAITGSEQRFIFQVGYQHIFGEDNGFNFFAEGGAVGTLAKFLKNQIAINNLTIDLAGYYTQPLYNDFRLHNLSGIGFGAWGGLGLTTSANAKTTLQFVYNPSFEIIPLAENTAPHLQHYIGLRFYYNLWRRVIMKESF